MADPCPSFDFGQGLVLNQAFDVDCAKNKCAAAATVAQSVTIRLESLVTAALNRCTLKCQGTVEDCYACVLGEVNTALGDAAECYKNVVGLLVDEITANISDAGSVAELTCPPGYEPRDLVADGVDCDGNPYQVNATTCEPIVANAPTRPQTMRPASSLVAADMDQGDQAHPPDQAKTVTSRERIESLLEQSCSLDSTDGKADASKTPQLAAIGPADDVPQFDPLSINWSDPDLCQALEKAAGGKSGDGVPQTYQEWFAEELERIGGETKANLTKLESWLPSLIAVPIMAAINAAAALGLLVTGLMRSAAQRSQEMAGCPGGVSASLASRKQGLTFLSRWLGFDTSKADQSVEQAINYFCPVSVPSQGDANAAWLADEINEKTWQCFTRANNNVVWPQSAVVAAQRARPSGLELSVLFNRGVLSKTDYDEAMRENGYINKFDAGNTLALTAFWPGASDLIRFMVRDVFDAAVVERFQYDAEFDAKFAGNDKARTLAKGLGLSVDDARLYWRAHWDVPSNGQVYEMLHRLRPDHPDPAIKRVATTFEDARQVLAINDTLPFWRERLLAISYRPLTRVDAQRAYFIGAIGTDALLASYMDLGYTKENAATLVDFTSRLKAIRSQNEPETKAAAAGFMSFAVMKERLKQRGYDDGHAAHAETYARNAAELNTKRACLGASKRRYLIGLTSDQEAQQAIMATAGDPEQGFLVLAAWKCERAARGKALSAAQLCKSFTNGLLSAADYSAALVRVGYSARDASMIARNCDIVRLDKLNKAAVKQQKEIAGQSEKVRKQLEKQALAAAKQAEKTLKAAETAKAKADKLKAKLTGIAAALAERLGIDESTVAADVGSSWNLAIATDNLTPEAAFDVINTAAKSFQGKTLNEWKDHAKDVSTSSRGIRT